jgi:outer membrane protein assembly factor BamB
MMNDEGTLSRMRFIVQSRPYPSFIVLLLVCLLFLAVGGCRRATEVSDSTESNSSRPQRHKDATVNKQQSPSPGSRPLGSLSSSWPMFRGNAQATGVAESDLPEKLELLWTFSSDKGGFESTAAIVAGRVYIGSTDGNLYALDLATGKEIWRFSTPLGFTASAAVKNGLVYIGDGDGKFYCIDAATGKKRWEFVTDGEIDSSANFHGDCVLFGSQDTFLYCLNAGSGKLAWKYQSQNQIRCFPTVVGDQGFVAGCDSRLHVIDLEKGVEVGDVSIDSPTGTSPAVLEKTIFVGTEGHTFFAIDPRDRKVLWRREPVDRGAAFRSSAAVTPAAVIVGARDRRLHAFDPKTGKPLWSFTTKGRVDSSPVIVGDRVFFGSGDGRVYAADIKTGAERWRFTAGGAVVASPAVAEECLVIGNDVGQLYGFGRK